MQRNEPGHYRGAFCHPHVFSFLYLPRDFLPHIPLHCTPSQGALILQLLFDKSLDLELVWQHQNVRKLILQCKEDLVQQIVSAYLVGALDPGEVSSGEKDIDDQSQFLTGDDVIGREDILDEIAVYFVKSYRDNMLKHVYAKVLLSKN